MSATISIPFPVWDGIFQINRVVTELQQNVSLGDVLPNDMNNPRKMEFREIDVPAGTTFDTCLKVEYWYTAGLYAVATLGGRSTHYGTTWELIKCQLKWNDPQRKMLEKTRLKVELGENEIKATNLVNYFRIHFHEYVDKKAAEKQLLDAEELMFPILADLEMQINSCRA